MSRKTLYIFDFDGTLTATDTLIGFLRHSFGSLRLLLSLLWFSPLLVLMKLGLVDNGRQKERVFAHFFRGMTEDCFNELCRDYARHSAASIIRPGARAEIDRAQCDGAEVWIVSASMPQWVSPIVATIAPNIRVVGTEPEVVGGRLTGRFATANCYGPEKVNRIEELLAADRTHYYILAFGDSRGDREMLNYADESHFKPFR